MPDAKTALDAAERAFDLFRRDYLVASVVVLLLVNGVWAWAFSRVWGRLNEVQDKRVEDQIAGEKRANLVAERLAAHMDKATETSVVVLRAVDELLRSKGRRPSAPVPVEAPK